MQLVNTTVPTKKTKKPMSNILYYAFKAVLFIVFLGIGKALTFYETNAPSLGEFFYPATVVIGCVIGIGFMTGVCFIEQKPPVWIKENPRPKTGGMVLIISLLCLMLVLLAAGIGASILWHPDMISHAGFTYLFGCIPGVVTVSILRYLPHILPQKEADTKSP